MVKMKKNLRKVQKNIIFLIDHLQKKKIILLITLVKKHFVMKNVKGLIFLVINKNK
jgi:hypothetical protein